MGYALLCNANQNNLQEVSAPVMRERELSPLSPFVYKDERIKFFEEVNGPKIGFERLCEYGA